MRVDLLAPEVWEDLNQSLTTELQVPGLEVMAFWGLNQALSELTLGLAKQFPHRKKVHYFKNMDPFFERHIIALSREGLKVEAHNWADFEKDPESFKTQIDKDSLFVLLSQDLPLLGRTFDIQKFLLALAQEKIFKICVSHQAPRQNWSEVFEKDRSIAQVFSLKPDLSLAFLGGRVRVSATAAQGMPWTKAVMEGALEEIRLIKETSKEIHKESELKARIEKFESLQIAGATAALVNQPRSFDRAVLYWTDIDGTAIIESLSEKRGLKLLPAGQEQRLETASPTRWGGLRTMDWLLAQGLDASATRGLVVFDQSLVDEKLAEDLKSVCLELRQLQGG